MQEFDKKAWVKESAARFVTPVQEDMKDFISKGGRATDFFEIKLIEIMAFYTFAFRDADPKQQFDCLRVLDALTQAAFNNVAQGLMTGVQKSVADSFSSMTLKGGKDANK